VTGAASASQATAERELVDALRRGEEDAFRNLVLTHDRGLRRMARLYVSEAFVDDVVQETWIVVVRAIGGFEGRSALRTWIFGILVNIARRRAAREGRSIPFAPVASASERYQGAVDPDRLQHPELGLGYWPAPPSWPRDPESSVLAAEARKVVSRAIGALPPAQREVMTLRDVEGWPTAEVSALLGISDVNQRTLLHRARVTVRRALEVYLGD
jgi:RNA polymerase sigma-70 factor (ECF subfamily)